MLALGEVKIKCRQVEGTSERVTLTVSVLRSSKLSTFSFKFLLLIVQDLGIYRDITVASPSQSRRL